MDAVEPISSSATDNETEINASDVWTGESDYSVYMSLSQHLTPFGLNRNLPWQLYARRPKRFGTADEAEAARRVYVSSKGHRGRRARRRNDLPWLAMPEMSPRQVQRVDVPRLGSGGEARPPAPPYGVRHPLLHPRMPESASNPTNASQPEEAAILYVVDERRVSVC